MQAASKKEREDLKRYTRKEKNWNDKNYPKTNTTRPEKKTRHSKNRGEKTILKPA